MNSRHEYLKRLVDDLACHRITRRDFTQRSAQLGLSASLVSAIFAVSGVEARSDDVRRTSNSAVTAKSMQNDDEEPTLVVASWGGNFGEAQRSAHFEPFMEEFGIDLILAPEQPDIALLQAQVESNNVTWDVANNSSFGAATLANKGVLQQIDYASMDADTVAGIDERVKGEYSVGIYFWSSILGYSLEVLESDAPTSWADFWNVDAFPGPRGLTEMNFEPPPLEIPLLAQGVAPEDLYPLDIDAAFASLDEIRDHITTWTGWGADAVQLMVQGELAMSTAGNGGLTNAIADGAPLGMEWNQGLVYYDAWSIPKGAPHPNNALKFIEFTMRPEVQAEFVKAYPIGAVNAAAYELVPGDVVANSTSAPDNLAVQVVTDNEWWTATPEGGDKTNLEIVYERWAEWIL